MPTLRMKPITYFVPFDHPLIERAVAAKGLANEEDIVPGYAFVREVVDGEGGIRLKRSAMEAATPEWLTYGNIREMHGKNAAGVCKHAEWDDTGLFIAPEIVDPIAKLKVQRNVYKGYSVGVQPLLMRGKDVESCKIVEISLVDRPKDPDALFTTYRAEDYDPEADFEVELVDAADEALEPLDRHSTAKDDAVPSPNEGPLAAGEMRIEEESGHFCLYGPDGQKLGEFPTREQAEARRAEIADAMKDGDGGPYDPSDQKETSKLPADPAESGKSRVEELDPHEKLQIEISPAGWRVIRASDGEAVAGGSNPSEMGVWMAEALKRQMPPVADSKTGVDESLTRMIKEEGGKFCVYSEDGRKRLGEYDTREAAEKRLKQIEYFKNEKERAATSQTVPARENLEGKAPGRKKKSDGEEYQEEISEEEGKAHPRAKPDLGQNDDPSQPDDNPRDDTNGNGLPDDREENDLNGAPRHKEPGKKKAVPPTAMNAPAPRRKTEPSDMKAVNCGDGLDDGDELLLRVDRLEGERLALMTRAERAESELLTVSEIRDELQRILDVTKEEVTRLQNAPVPSAPVLYPRALPPKFFANIGRAHESEQKQIIDRMAEIAQMAPTSDMGEQHRRASEMMVLKAALHQFS